LSKGFDFAGTHGGFFIVSSRRVKHKTGKIWMKRFGFLLENWG
jgi:hypothetical protein